MELINKLVGDESSLEVGQKINEIIDFGNSKLNTSKMYLTGSISTDEQGYNQLEEMYHSTFDLSKFEVVGSPTITSDGVLTNNFSDNTNYVSIPFGKIGNWRVDFQWKSPNTLVGSYILTSWASSFTRITVNNTYAQLSCILYMSDGTTLNLGNIQNVIKKANTIYNIYIEHNGTTYSFGIKELGSIEDKTLSVTSELEVKNNPFIIFANSDVTDKGSIDLKQFSITVDGKEVFNGNKTGLDVIKKDNYTVVGSPTISEDGIYSNGSNANYLTIPNSVFANIGNKPWKIELEGMLPAPTASPYPYVLGYKFEDNNSFLNLGRFNTTNNWFFNVKYNNNGTIASSGANYVAPLASDSNKPYSSYIEFTGTKYVMGLKTISMNEYRTVEVENSNPIMPQNNDLYVGAAMNNGSLNLNSLKLYVDGELTYQACLKIPYTESKTGSKIVPAYARDRVQDVYEQFGTEYLYYTIDEENKNFTLPMGEIYGMIENQKSNLPIGAVFPCLCSADYVPQYTLPCDGTEYTKNQFIDLWNNYLISGKLNTCTYAEYEADILAYGQCAKFAVDVENGTFKVPTILNQMVTGISNDAPVIYDLETTNSQMFRSPQADANGRINQLIGGGNDSDNSVGFAPFNTTAITNVYFGITTINCAGVKTIDGVAVNAISGKWYKANIDPNGTLKTDLTNANSTINVRYFVVVANGEINRSMMNWSEWASNLQVKANTDLSNVEPVQNFIDKIIEYNSIDYSSGIEISFPVETAPFTAPSDGVYITAVSYNNRTAYLYINGTKTSIVYSDPGNVVNLLLFEVSLSKGDVIYWNNTLSATTSTFYPLKGAK